jgi:hypothetical protein
MVKTYIIKQKQPNTGTIYDIASDKFDREIVFPPRHKYAVVLAAYYGPTAYTVHKTARAAAIASEDAKAYSHKIIDTDGNEYTARYGALCADFD